MECEIAAICNDFDKGSYCVGHTCSDNSDCFDGYCDIYSIPKICNST